MRLSSRSDVDNRYRDGTSMSKRLGSQELVDDDLRSRLPRDRPDAQPVRFPVPTSASSRGFPVPAIPKARGFPSIGDKRAPSDYDVYQSAAGSKQPRFEDHKF